MHGAIRTGASQFFCVLTSLAATELLAATAGSGGLSVLERGLGASVALAGAGSGLVNGLGRQLRLFPLGVKLRVIA